MLPGFFVCLKIGHFCFRELYCLLFWLRMNQFYQHYNCNIAKPYILFWLSVNHIIENILVHSMFFLVNHIIENIIVLLLDITIVSAIYSM